MLRSRILSVLVALFLCVLAVQCRYIFAQAFTADLLGTVQDASGATIPSANLTLTQVTTGTKFTASTDEAGNFAFAQLLPGRYRLEVSKAGFKIKTVSEIELSVGQRSRIDVALEVGAMAQRVEVNAGGTQLIETQSSEIGQVVNNQAVIQLPLNGRNFIQLATFVPGVYPASNDNNGSSCAQVFTGGGGLGGSSVSAMGLRDSNVSYLIDGIETRAARFGNVTIKPAPDAIQEFKMETSNFEADSGRSSVITNITLKSGSNGFHGSAYEFIRNSSLDANDFFLNEAGVTRPEFQQNNFGASAGGAFKRDKAFYFGAYEGLRSGEGEAFTGLYPSAAQLAGNLADDSAGTGFFPTSSTFCQANPSSPKCLNVSNPFTGVPFPGNVIPKAMLDPTAQKFVPYFRVPNVAVTPNQPGLPPFNVAFSSEQINTDNQFHGRFDYNISSKDRFFASYSYDDRPHILPELSVDASSTFPWRGQALASNWTHSFGATTVNELRIGYDRSRNAFLPTTAYGPNVAETVIGLQNVDPVPATYAIPAVCICGFSSVGYSGVVADSTDQTYQFSDTLAVVKGRHTLKVGGAYYHEKYTFICPCAVGSFAFCGAFSGTGLGDFLTGVPFSEAASFGDAVLDSRADYFGEFFQDDFRVRRDLTLNLGIRYETQEWPRDIDGREETYVPATQSVEAVFRGQIRNGIAKTPHKDFGPRVGLAYAPNFLHSTVIRAGFGIFYSTDVWDEFGSFAAFGPDFIVLRQATSNPQTPTLALSNAFPAITLGLLSIPPGTTIYAMDPSNTIPYVQEWNLDVQHSFGPNWLVDVAYAGSVGQHLFQRRDENLPTIDPTGTIPVAQRRPNPEYGLILTSYTGGWSDFDALLTKVEHRTTKNGYLLGSFTWAHALDLGTCCDFNGINRQFKVRNRGPSDLVAPLRASIAYVYELPVGRGKAFLAGAPTLVDKLLGGWTVNGIETFASGLFTTPKLGYDFADLGNGVTEVPNTVGSPVPADQTINRYWTAKAYALPGCPSLTPCATEQHIDGNAQRNSLEAPGINNWDLSFVKNTQLAEGLSLQFRSEFFNAFNHPQFGNPNNNTHSGEFGVISSLGQSPRQIQFGLKLLW